MSMTGDIYREAAELIASGSQLYPCYAIGDLAIIRFNDHFESVGSLENWANSLVYQYVLMFSENDDAHLAAKMFDFPIEERQNLRVLMLCLMAAIADSEED